MKRVYLAFLIAMVFTLVAVIPGCDNGDVNSYTTFVLNEGCVHFSLEYRTYYTVDHIKPAEATGHVGQRKMFFDLISPKIKGINDYTYIHVAAVLPDELVPDAKSAIERAERLASSWADYELLDKYELTVDGVHAYRLDYQNRNIVPAIAGVSGPTIEVVREVRFDANGFVWMIQMRSDSSTAEADKADFEHILETFQILD